MTIQLRNSFTSPLQYLQNTCLVNTEPKLTTYRARQWQMWSKILPFGVPVIHARDANTLSFTFSGHTTP